jgi:hypothetical protein
MWFPSHIHHVPENCEHISVVVDPINEPVFDTKENMLFSLKLSFHTNTTIYRTNTNTTIYRTNI